MRPGARVTLVDTKPGYLSGVGATVIHRQPGEDRTLVLVDLDPRARRFAGGEWCFANVNLKERIVIDHPFLTELRSGVFDNQDGRTLLGNIKTAIEQQLQRIDEQLVRSAPEGTEVYIKPGTVSPKYLGGARGVLVTAEGVGRIRVDLGQPIGRFGRYVNCLPSQVALVAA